MPRTKQIDDSVVVEAYERLQNARAVARELGWLHHNTVIQVLRRHRGVCLRCQAPVLPGHKQCAKCEEWERARVKKRRKERRRLGLCADCDKPVAPPSRIYCSEHRIAAIERNETYTAKRQPGAAEGGAPNLEQKLTSIRLLYGKDGVACFLEADGRCEICPTHYTEAAVHIHHIDEDRTNNERSNFACLCWRCHRTVHLLLAAGIHLPAVLAWFRRTYPAALNDQVMT